MFRHVYSDIKSKIKFTMPTTCSICLDPIEANEQTLQCNHFFHTKCISTWFETSGIRNQVCPLCRHVEFCPYCEGSHAKTTCDKKNEMKEMMTTKINRILLSNILGFDCVMKFSRLNCENHDECKALIECFDQIVQSSMVSPISEIFIVHMYCSYHERVLPIYRADNNGRPRMNDLIEAVFGKDMQNEKDTESIYHTNSSHWEDENTRLIGLTNVVSLSHQAPIIRGQGRRQINENMLETQYQQFFDVPRCIFPPALAIDFEVDDSAAAHYRERIMFITSNTVQLIVPHPKIKCRVNKKKRQQRRKHNTGRYNQHRQPRTRNFCRRQ